MQLSVIILNYNVRYFLEICIKSVQKALQNIDAEIIVIDNNSSDDSCTMIKQRFPEVKLIENIENYGFPKGNNIGVGQATGEYICILNPDTVVAEDTFVKILNFHETNSNIGIIGCKLIDGKGNFLPESKRGIPTPWVALTKIIGLYKFFPKSKYFNQYYASHLNENQSGKVDILVGAFMLIKRKLYNEIGGFDENCFMYSDDIDLSYMVLKMGYSNFYFHDTTVIHYKGESTIKDEKYRKNFQDAMEFFYKKHFRSSYFFSFFMKIGGYFFLIFKKNQSSLIPNKSSKYLLISEDEKTKIKVENLLGKNILRLKTATLNSLNSFELNSENDIEIIFDNNHLDFKTIIKFMEQNKNDKLTFKILPQKCNFLIGSNNSNDRGEVLLF